MQPLPGYREEDMYWKLRKCLYSLNQSALEWYGKLSNSLLSKGFPPSSFDPCIFFYTDKTFYISVYVENITIYGPNSLLVSQTI